MARFTITSGACVGAKRRLTADGPEHLVENAQTVTIDRLADSLEPSDNPCRVPGTSIYRTKRRFSANASTCPSGTLSYPTSNQPSFRPPRADDQSRRWSDFGVNRLDQSPKAHFLAGRYTLFGVYPLGGYQPIVAHEDPVTQLVKVH